LPLASSALIGVGRVALGLLGMLLVGWTGLAAVRTVVVPRAEQVALTNFVFVHLRRIFDLLAKRLNTYEARDRLMAFYAPLSLMSLPFVWLGLMTTGYAAVLLALENDGVRRAFLVSGSSLLTLGFASPNALSADAIVFTEAAVGVGLVALLITFLPSMYTAFSHRETAVALLEVRAGNPPSGTAMVRRYYLIEGFDALEAQWSTWEQWFAEIAESHTSYPALVFFRSPTHHRSWITAAGAVLDAAALMSSSVKVERAPLANLCIRSGYVTLREIADYFQIPYPIDPQRGDPISVERAEFDAAYDELASIGVPMKPDRERAWQDFAGWRVNYDAVLLALASLTMAPLAPWSSDRSGPYRRPRVLRRTRSTARRRSESRNENRTRTRPHRRSR
jgi:hypothetical protein